MLGSWDVLAGGIGGSVDAVTGAVIGPDRESRLIGVVISEFIGSTRGMVFLIITSLATLNSTDMFASVVMPSAVGCILVTLIRRAERRLLRWAPEFRS